MTPKAVNIIQIKNTIIQTVFNNNCRMNAKCFKPLY